MFLTTIITNESLLKKAKTLNTTGIIIQKDQYCYLKIEDAYIHDLFNLLNSSFTITKPDYFSSADSAGAHITIAYTEETITLDQEDIGTMRTFSITTLCHAVLKNKKYLVLIVSSPSLCQLRTKYGLPGNPMYKGIPIEFHVTLANVI